MEIQIGQRFGKLVVKSRNGSNLRGDRLWLCVCDCGNSHVVKTNSLTSGKTASCGCKKRGCRRDDSIIGTDINVFHIIGFSHVNKWRELVYDCKCLRCGRLVKIKRPKIVKMKSCCLCQWDDYKDITHGHWARIKLQAKSRSLEFNITQEYAWRIFEEQKGKCALSGVPLVLCRGWTGKLTASLDRIDGSKGYIEGNVRWVHKVLNMLRQNRPTDTFIYWCKKVAEYNKDTCNE